MQRALRSRWFQRLASCLLLSLGTRACLIHPEKDYPVGTPSALTDAGGEAGAAPSSGAPPVPNNGGDAGGVPLAEGGQGGSPGPVDGLPRSCAEARARGNTADGAVQLDPDGSGPLKPFAIYCARMATAEPQEFLELPHTDATGFAGMNTSTYGDLGSDPCPCSGPITSTFSKVRLRLADLTVLIIDRSFASIAGNPACLSSSLQGACNQVYLGYATAVDCAGSGTSGTAEIDLGDTPFHIAPTATFAPFGYAPDGKVAISGDRKRAGIVGGGFCGGYAPADPKYVSGAWQTGGELALEQD